MIRSIADLQQMKEAYLEKMGQYTHLCMCATVQDVCLPAVKMSETPWWKSWKKQDFLTK